MNYSGRTNNNHMANQNFKPLLKMAVSAAVPAGVEIRQADVRKTDMSRSFDTSPLCHEDDAFVAEFITNAVVNGKGLFATTSFREGDVILTETPLVSAQFCWNELYKYKACEFCLRSLETAEEMSQRLTENPALTLPHPECCAVDPSVFSLCPQCQVLYCSEACRTEAWNRYHRVLCMGPSRTDGKHPLLQLQETWRNIHYPPETSSIMLLVKMAAMVRQSPDPKRMVDRFSKFVHTTVNEEEEIMHKLLGKEFQGQLEVLRSLAAECLYHEDIQQWLTPEGFQSVFALIGTNGQGIGSSSISKWVKNCESLVLSSEEKEQLDAFIDQLYIDLDQVSGAFLNCEGSGLYELQSACNHSCVPNAEISFLHGNHTLTLSCARDIEQGEEIFISYLDECDVDRSRHSRQKILRENYLFICTCPKCLEQAGDIDETSEEEMSEGEEGDMGD